MPEQSDKIDQTIQKANIVSDAILEVAGDKSANVQVMITALMMSAASTAASVIALLGNEREGELRGAMIKEFTLMLDRALERAKEMGGLGSDFGLA